ncbi:hypothetical protein RPMA_18200 [Tardiphaga alba]|uniref:Uncharacterized protein n=1 Tax=Tardiphaga alba TaxID=340268 RepID=A0ABX8AFH1_9BRAD|nr:hypothetical protein [Tardiphaga alba]QUS40550.1 hypothetical protein RPMA_18200 [Tardiphaga alba]
MTEQERAYRNLHPHAEAQMAMWLWGDEYSQQRGGSMDFWDSLGASRRNHCIDCVSYILKSHQENGRATGEMPA